MRYAQEKLETICQALQTDPETGLTAQQAAEIQKAKGLNTFDEEKKETIPQKIAHQLRDITSLILLAASGIALLLAVQSGHGYTDAVVILAIVVLNVILAVRQERGAEKALEALKSMNAHMTVAIRGGAKQALDATALVPGDILALEAGDMIPADARIIESANLKAEESVLTGESVPVEKDATALVPEKAALGDQLNMLFSGCLITNGRAKAVVVATGMDTEMGKIAGLLNNTKKVRTPLQKRLAGLAKTMSVIALGAAAVMFVLEFLYGANILEILMNAVALAVAVVPETLPVIVTITLAYGIHNMARKHAIIRKIPAVETLGSASVICSDKTGTLTMNRMSIQKIWAAGHAPKNAREGFTHDETFLLEIMGLASNASIDTSGGEEKAVGDPTETAIIRLLLDKNITKESLDALFPKAHEIPFDSQRKLMTTVHKLEDGRYLSITKGAFDRLPVDAASYCADTARRVHDEFAAGALRVLAAAYKYYDTLPGDLGAGELERGLTFAGFVGMIDPPRPESAAAVAQARQAGIRTVMITGDHVGTASAIAREIGILSHGDKALSGVELEAMPDGDLTRGIRDYSVYARVSPEDKIRIVEAWQAQGEVVAMTGDGVNDAPALKAADVGVAMGSGTDVSKSASDMILTDDNFASIVDAVAEGRRVYDNIRKVLYSLLSSNFSEIFIMLIAILLGWGAPLAAIQLLLINVVADGIPDMFMCKEPAEAGAMKRKPAGKKAGIFADGLSKKIGTMASVFTLVSLAGFIVGKFATLPGAVAPSHEVGQTMAFVVLGWASVVNIFNARSHTRSAFKTGLASNKPLCLALLFSIGLIASLASVPALMGMFYCVPVGLYHWLIMVGLSLVPLAVGEIEKLIHRSRN